jgi:prevent-host-death family protein
VELVGVAELKKRLSEYLDRVKEGEEVIVSERGRPVARLMPFQSVPLSDEEEELRMIDLQRRGLIRLGTGDLPADFWDRDRAEDPEDRLQAALQADRDESEFSGCTRSVPLTPCS